MKFSIRSSTRAVNTMKSSLMRWLLLPLLLAAHCPDKRETQAELLKTAWLEANSAFTTWTEVESEQITMLESDGEAQRRFERLDRTIVVWQELREAFEAALATHEAGTPNEAALTDILERGRKLLKDLETQ